MKNFYHRKVTQFKVAIADISDLGGEHWITRINVPPGFRGKGLAREMLAEILSDADREGVKLHLQIQPSGSDGLTYNQLAAWYGRNGFKMSEEIPGIMTREALHV